MELAQIGWELPEISPELAELVAQVRSAEKSLLKFYRYIGEEKSRALVREMVLGNAGGVCEQPIDQLQTIEEFCEACLEAGSSVDDDQQRVMLRERARIYLHFAKDTQAVTTCEDLLRMWDEATRGEPCIRLAVDGPRWRTDADDPGPFAPEPKGADPADIPQLAEAVVGFLRCDDLPCEVSALSLFHLMPRIRPFACGNGHVLRMLVCDVMHRAGYSEPTLLAFVNELAERQAEVCGLSADVALGKASAQDHVAFLLNVLLQAQEALEYRLYWGDAK